MVGAPGTFRGAVAGPRVLSGGHQGALLGRLEGGRHGRPSNCLGPMALEVPKTLRWRGIETSCTCPDARGSSRGTTDPWTVPLPAGPETSMPHATHSWIISWRDQPSFYCKGERGVKFRTHLRFVTIRSCRHSLASKDDQGDRSTFFALETSEWFGIKV